MFPFEEADYSNGEIYPNSKGEEHLATTVAGMEWKVLLETNDWKKRESFDLFKEAFQTMPKPMLFHCKTSYSANFVAGLHHAFVYKSNIQPALKTVDIGQKEFYRHSEMTGHDYTNDDILREIVADVLQEPVMCNPRKPVLSVIKWYATYWIVKPIYGNVYVAGQIQSSHAKKINELNFQSIINVRRQVTDDTGAPSQEEVTLLNIRDRTGTYENGGRQTISQLEANILNKDLLNTYISESSSVNYESRNPLEYGDDVGYNETVERIHLSNDHGFNYQSTVIGNNNRY